MNTNLIRNFCIIAHIDHGKSTLADRFLEVTSTLDNREMKHGQMLDMMELEQERGITIKLAPVRMTWEHQGKPYILNLIDTPGHVDFTYEVSRSLAACEAAVLVVDATQGIQAQTLANCYLALEHDLEIIPVINKIDLPAADIEKVSSEIENTLGIPREEIIAISAKEGTHVETVLDRIIVRTPPPKEAPNDAELKALIFDSIYDPYRGVVTYVRVFSGSIKRGDQIYFLRSKKKVEVVEVGHFKPKYVAADGLSVGEIGYVITGVKEVGEARVGDTVWKPSGQVKEASKATPLPGYKVVQPFVFASIFCINTDEYPLLRNALDKLKLNDSSLTFVPEQSGALGHGFRCGFLGLLHLDIVKERLEREYDLDLIVTAPSVSYRVVQQGKGEYEISNPSGLPDPSTIQELKEPWVKTEILIPREMVGGVLSLCQGKRGIYRNMQYIDEKRVILEFELPLASIVVDFYDSLKSVTSGYASMNYEFLEYRTEKLVRVDILIAGNIVEPLSLIVHFTEAQTTGSKIVKRLRELIPKANFEIALQAAIGGKIIARETISALRKDVTAKLYGGDRTRKDKLLKKQKKGKKRMKMIGKVEMPQAAFLAILQKS